MEPSTFLDRNKRGLRTVENDWAGPETRYPNCLRAKPMASIPDNARGGNSVMLSRSHMIRVTL